MLSQVANLTTAIRATSNDDNDDDNDDNVAEPLTDGEITTLTKVLSTVAEELDDSESLDVDDFADVSVPCQIYICYYSFYNKVS